MYKSSVDKANYREYTSRYFCAGLGNDAGLTLMEVVNDFEDF